jgi:hypothetical protein
MDGPSFSSRGISLGGAQPVVIQKPSTPDSGRTGQGAGVSSPAVSNAVTPACVVDFSGSRPGRYVLDWRDPTTKTVLVQVPMRTAFAQLAGLEGAATPEHVGTRLDTTA